MSLLSTINVVYILEINIFGWDYSNLKNREQGIERTGTIFDAICYIWKKVQQNCKSEHLKIVTNGHHYTFQRLQKMNSLHFE